MGVVLKSLLTWPCILMVGIGVLSPDMLNLLDDNGGGSGGGTSSRVVFATYAESDEQLHVVVLLAESVREFGGKFNDVPIWLYVPEQFEEPDSGTIGRLKELGVAIRSSEAPDETSWFYYAGKVFAAGVAERAAEKEKAILVWLDADTIFLGEPKAFCLPAAVSIAFRPVMHNRSGTLYGKEPNRYWQCIYERLHIRPEQLFAMTTPADHQVINTYFHAGLLVVRPERGILRGWGESFRELCRDSALTAMCREDEDNRIFLHQTALVGAILHRLSRAEMVELPDTYNYPLFFDRTFGADHAFDSLNGVVTLRYHYYFRKPDPDWAARLKGPARQIDWLKSRLASAP